jgi:3-phosphoshikimate 1-carboxyvinyltransferase
MTGIRIHPGRVEGRLRAPASKSWTHRAYILGALSGNGLVHHPLRSDDTDATLEALRRLGFLVTHEAAGTRVGGVLRPPRQPLDCRASGTTLRILVTVASLLDAPVTFIGEPRLGERPLDPLLEALRSLGVRAQRAAEGFPLTVHGPLQGGTCRLPGDVSSQFLTGLLLAAPLAPAPVRIEITTPLRSRPYVDVTLSMLRSHGVRVHEDADAFVVDAPQRIRQRPFDVPGDWSSAAFLLSAAAITGGRVALEGLRPDDEQGDKAIVDHLATFGAHVRQAPGAVEVEGATLEAADVDVAATPDLFPILATLAARARGTSRLHGAPHLRLKESDRIHAVRANLAAFGVAAEERPDGLTVPGGPVRGATIQSFGDHRIAMAAAILALAADGPSLLPDPDVVKKSYPDFARDVAQLCPGAVA